MTDLFCIVIPIYFSLIKKESRNELEFSSPRRATMWPYILTSPVVNFRFIVLYFLLLVSSLYT